MLADRVQWGGIHWNVPLWPFILITLGVAKLQNRQIDARGRSRLNRGGGWLMFIGAWGLINEYHLFGARFHNSWPLLIIGAGAMVVCQAVDPYTCNPTLPPKSRS
jgi:hypothetical protein